MRRESSPEGVSSETDEQASSPLFDTFGINAGFVEDLREQFQVDPGSVDSSWAEHFGAGGEAARSEPTPSHARREASEAQKAELPRLRSVPAATEPSEAHGFDPNVADRHARVLRMIHAFRARGHRIARSDPLEGQSTYFPELDPAHYGFGHEDLDAPYAAGDLPGGAVQTLREILECLRATYCGPIGVEYTHVQDPGRKAWLQTAMEEGQNQPQLESADRKRILEKLSAAELFERFLHTKFIGQKRFSLEGAESVIPLLDTVVEDSPSHGIREIVFGMAHRGRLNVLSNTLGKSYESIFSEFEDSPLLDSPFGSGDVKYHKGFSNDRRVASGQRVHMTLTSNPSHLEAVDPVVEGRAKAKQVRSGDTEGRTILPVILHGDAAFAGQGMVAETLNLSHLRGYSTGGTLHVIINNQIGFTTTPSEARSTLYCSDVAKMIQIPIFHVNGDDPEAVIHCVKLAMAYRQRFGDDVVIDMVCYRRHGHNEGDEPSYTQPRLYEKIRKRPSVRRLYSQHLVETGVISEDDAARIETDLGDQLQQALQVIHTRPPGPDEPYEPHGPWTGYMRTRPEEEQATAVPMDVLTRIAEGIGTVPADFKVHPKLRTLLDRRRKAIPEDARLDWAMGEALAFGSLVLDGHPVRLSGQDSSRGTFSHRHAVFVDQETGEEYTPLDHLSEDQARFEVYDCLLSEAAVLGFEYGYSLADPSTLTLWEAQFGDFANGAQVIIDQFITSAHVKWQRMSGLVMLLPHGYEGQGPEHSSARIERFLQICAEDCLQVANCTTPAQYFHLLRRQMLRGYRAPLVIFTPKSLLRLPAATSPVAEFTDGGFQPVLDDPLTASRTDDVRRVILCSGKVYYDLLAEREGRFGDAAGKVALVRIEELYPWPDELVAETVRSYPRAERVVWVQEEPANMGAWTFVRERIQDALLPNEKLAYAGRHPSASPATGSTRVHRLEQAALLDHAFDGLD
ncbi:MAG: 2-oxoglutarate dehydrogenase E1 component [Proteobacteria bacterium]|nr:2-oxoglutarate dehydrogenase E1 component [Pseudomonadota bacterium]